MLVGETGRGEAGLPGPRQEGIGQEPYNSAQASHIKWLEHWPVHQNITGLTSGQGQVLDFRFHPWPIWEACRMQPICVSIIHQCFSATSLPSIYVPSTLKKKRAWKIYSWA